MDKGQEIAALPRPRNNLNQIQGYIAAKTIESVKRELGIERVLKLAGNDPFWSGNLEELSRILRRLGLQVNTFFTENQGMEAIRTSSAAALNIIVNPWLLKGAAKEYEERFGIPSLRIPGLPVGASDTSRFVRQVAEALKLDVYHYLETAIGGLSWKRFAVVGDANTAVGVTRYLANDYSFTPVITVITDPMFRDEDKERIEEQIRELDYAAAPKLIRMKESWRWKWIFNAV